MAGKNTTVSPCAPTPARSPQLPGTLIASICGLQNRMNLGSRLSDVPAQVTGDWVWDTATWGSTCWSCRMAVLVTCTLWAAGVLGARRVLAEQRRAHLGLTQHPPAVAGALGTGVDVPRFSFHKVFSSGGVANGRGAELWLLHHKVIWGRTQNPNIRNDSSAVRQHLKNPVLGALKGAEKTK